MLFIAIFPPPLLRREGRGRRKKGIAGAGLSSDIYYSPLYIYHFPGNEEGKEGGTESAIISNQIFH